MKIINKDIFFKYCIFYLYITITIIQVRAQNDSISFYEPPTKYISKDIFSQIYTEKIFIDNNGILNYYPKSIFITFYDTTSIVKEIFEIKKIPYLRKEKIVKNGIYLKFDRKGSLIIIGRYFNNHKRREWFYINNNQIYNFEIYR